MSDADEKTQANLAKDTLQNLLNSSGNFNIQKDKYGGQVVARVETPNKLDITQQFIKAGVMNCKS